MGKIRNVLAGVAITAMLIAVPTPASADPTGTEHQDKTLLAGPVTGEPAKLAEFFAKQQKLDAAADAIRAASGSDAQSGFAGDEVDARANTLTLYWHGQVPKSVTARIDAVHRTGTAVNLQAAEYSLHTLQREADRLIGRVTSAGQVVAAGPAADGSGVEIGIAPTKGKSLTASDVRKVTTTELTAGVALDVSVQDPPELTWRINDIEPYWGGAVIVRDGGGACTSGFGVRGINGAARYLLTAAHCGDGRWRDGAGDLIGNTLDNTNREYDGMLILTNAGDAVYEGPSFATGDTNVGRSISASAANHVGDMVCTSGAFSGSACGWSVKALNQSIRPQNYPVTIRGLVRAEASNHVAGTGNGDSGGPVYTQNGYDGVARGVISLRSDVDSEIVACNGVPSGDRNDPNSRQCSWKWWYADISAVLSRLSVHFAP